jgi:hypothetical protein
MNAIPFFPYGKFGVCPEQIDPDQIPFADVRSRREDGSPARRSTASGPFLLDLGMGEQRSQTGPTYDVDLNTYCISPRQLEPCAVCGEWTRYAERQCKLFRRLDL